MKLNSSEIGDFLKALRKTKGLTQAEIADMLNVSNKTISKWENGLGIPEVSTLLMLADLYDVTVDDILRGSKKMPKHEDKAVHRLNYIIQKTKNQYLSFFLGLGGIQILSLVLLFVIGESTLNSTASSGISAVLLIVASFMQLFNLNRVKYQTLELENDHKKVIQRQVFHTSYVFFTISFGLIVLASLYNVGPHAAPIFQQFLVYEITPLFVGVFLSSVGLYWLILLLFRFDFLPFPSKWTIIYQISFSIVLVVPFFILLVVSPTELAIRFELESVASTSHHINTSKTEYFELVLLEKIAEANKQGLDEMAIVEIKQETHGSFVYYRFEKPEVFEYMVNESYFRNQILVNAQSYIQYDINDTVAKAYWMASPIVRIHQEAYSFLVGNLIGIYQLVVVVGYILSKRKKNHPQSRNTSNK